MREAWAWRRLDECGNRASRPIADGRGGRSDHRCRGAARSHRGAAAECGGMIARRCAFLGCSAVVARTFVGRLLRLSVSHRHRHVIHGARHDTVIVQRAMCRGPTQRELGEGESEGHGCETTELQHEGKIPANRMLWGSGECRMPVIQTLISRDCSSGMLEPGRVKKRVQVECRAASERTVAACPPTDHGRTQKRTRRPSDTFRPAFSAKFLMRLVASRYFSSRTLSARSVTELTRPPAEKV